MEKENKKSYEWLDLGKLYFSIMVVIIHTSPFLEFNNKIYNNTIDYFTKGPVPFFFLCAGFFFGKKFWEAKGKEEVKIICDNYTKRLIIPYVIWGSFYFLVNIFFDVYGNQSMNIISSIKYRLQLLVVSGPGGALWYIYANILLLCLIKLVYKNKNTIVKMLVVALVLRLIMDIWESVEFENTLVSQIVDVYYKIFINTLNFLFRSHHFLIGMLFAYKNNIEKIKFKYALPTAILSMAGFVILNEVFAGNNTIVINFFKSYVFTVLYEVSIFVTLYSLPVKLNINTMKARKISTVIYFTHFATIYLCKMALKVLGIHSHTSTFIFIGSMCILIPWAWYITGKNNKLSKTLY